MLELILPVAMRVNKNGEDEFIYRTFAEDDIEELVIPFRKVAADLFAEGGAVAPSINT